MIETEVRKNISSSFRDPSGFVFSMNKLIYRQINVSYKQNYDKLMNSGLYKVLIDFDLLIPHIESDFENFITDNVYKIIKPEMIPFISYPYEWSFSQLKDAALLTLEIQKKALEFSMSLKDCSAYNIQFREGRPVFIDTLSFEEYKEGEPWVAYKQFCQHFIAPLALMCYRDISLNKLLQVHLDGIPLDITSSILPLRTKFMFSVFIHIHSHAKAQNYYSDKLINKPPKKVTKFSLRGLLDNLESIIKKMRWKTYNTEWGNYYDNTNYSKDGFNNKKQIIADFIDRIDPKLIWDFGANTGVFSRIASKNRIPVVSFDIDPVAVEKNYLYSKGKKEKNVLPILFDITNPSPGIGWENKERMSLLKRGPVDTVLALALIHHLAISNNLPLNKIAAFFNNICFSLIIEFIPKEDSQVQKLLSTREDIFPNYTKQNFELMFGKYFIILEQKKINDSERILYLMTKKK